MTKEYQAFQKLEEVLQSKKTVLQSCIQEWEPIIQALEAIEAARQEDKKRKIKKANGMVSDGGLSATPFGTQGTYQKFRDGDPIDTRKKVVQEDELVMWQQLLRENEERLKQEQEKKEIRQMVEQIKKDRFTGWTDDGSKKDKNGEPFIDFMKLYDKMMGKQR